MVYDISSRIGLGLATLMREPSSSKRQHLLHKAYELGIRHFDVAPLYGLGAAEAELGRFLSTVDVSGITVASKCGREASRSARALGPFQSVARRAVRSSQHIRSSLRALEKRASGGAQGADPIDVVASAWKSVELLGVEKLDLMLLHELQHAPYLDDFFFSIQEDLLGGAAKLPFRSFGASGGTALLNSFPISGYGNRFVLQGPAELSSIYPNNPHIYHSVVSEFAVAMRGALVAQPRVMESLSRIFSLVELGPRVCRAVAVTALLRRQPSSTVIIGTTSEVHLRQILADVELLHGSDLVQQDSGALLDSLLSRALELSRPSRHGKLAGAP